MTTHILFHDRAAFCRFLLPMAGLLSVVTLTGCAAQPMPTPNAIKQQATMNARIFATRTAAALSTGTTGAATSTVLRTPAPIATGTPVPVHTPALAGTVREICPYTAEAGDALKEALAVFQKVQDANLSAESVADCEQKLGDLSIAFGRELVPAGASDLQALTAGAIISTKQLCTAWRTYGTTSGLGSVNYPLAAVISASNEVVRLRGLYACP